MKHFFCLLFLCISVCAVRAQSFTALHDTMYISLTADTVSRDTIINTTSSAVNIRWQVVASDFPACWKENTAICDMSHCYGMLELWPSPMLRNVTYPAGAEPFNCITDVSPCMPGCYYLTARLHNVAIPTDTALITYIICKPVPAAVGMVKTSSEINVFPDPATATINVAYGTNDIAKIEVYNLVGRLMGAYTCSKGNAAIDVNSLVPGVYMVRLVDAHGRVAATRKFTKQ